MTTVLTARDLEIENEAPFANVKAVVESIAEYR